MPEGKRIGVYQGEERVTQIDWPTFINWIVSGVVGLMFGVIGSWVAYRYQLKRDDLEWQRKQKMERDRFRREMELKDREFEHSYQKLLQEANIIEREKRRLELLRDVDNPIPAIERLRKVNLELHKGIRSLTENRLDMAKFYMEVVPPTLYPLYKEDSVYKESIFMAEFLTEWWRKTHTFVGNLEKSQTYVDEAIDIIKNELHFIQKQNETYQDYSI